MAKFANQTEPKRKTNHNVKAGTPVQRFNLSPSSLPALTFLQPTNASGLVGINGEGV